VAPGSPAEKSGLKTGDVVLAFNGGAVGDSGQLAALVGESKPGDKVELEVLRDGKRRKLTATLGTSDSGEQQAAADEVAGKGRLGLAVRPLTPQEREAANVAAGGLLVEGVNGAAARAGVAPGDIVLQAGGKPVNSVEDLRAATRQDKTVALLVQRGGQRLFVPIQAG
jgi:serine protease Do